MIIESKYQCDWTGCERQIIATTKNFNYLSDCGWETRGINENLHLCPKHKYHSTEQLEEAINNAH